MCACLALSGCWCVRVLVRLCVCKLEFPFVSLSFIRPARLSHWSSSLPPSSALCRFCLCGQQFTAIRSPVRVCPSVRLCVSAFVCLLLALGSARSGGLCLLSPWSGSPPPPNRAWRIGPRGLWPPQAASSATPRWRPRAARSGSSRARWISSASPNAAALVPCPQLVRSLAQILPERTLCMCLRARAAEFASSAVGSVRWLSSPNALL